MTPFSQLREVSWSVVCAACTETERGDSKVESNDSHEIPDRGETSDIPGLPSEAAEQEPYKKAYLLTKNIEEFSGKSLEERASRQKTIRQKG